MLQEFLQLSFPLLIAQLGVVLLNVVDMVMLAHYSQQAMAACILGNIIIFSTLLLGIGILMGIDPFISQSKKEEHALRRNYFQSGLILSFLISLFIAILWLCSPVLISISAQNTEIQKLAYHYILIQIPGLFPFFVYMLLRQYYINLQITKPLVLILILSNIINLFLNYLFIYGNWGFPQMGILGAGISTTLMRFMQLFVFLFMVKSSTKSRIYYQSLFPLKWDLFYIKKILKMGMPIGLYMGLEALGFQIMSILAARMTQDILIVHGVILNLMYLLFCFPMSMSLTLASLSGNAIAQKKYDKVHFALISNIKYSALILLLVIFAAIANLPSIKEFYSLNELQFDLLATHYFYPFLFYLFYGTQLAISGALRGIKLTVVPSILQFSGLYFIALPLALFFFNFPLDAIWGSLFLAELLISFCLLLYIYKVKDKAYA